MPYRALGPLSILVNTLTADYVYTRRLRYFYPFLFNLLYLEKEKSYDAEILTI